MVKLYMRHVHHPLTCGACVYFRTDVPCGTQGLDPKIDPRTNPKARGKSPGRSAAEEHSIRLHIPYD